MRCWSLVVLLVPAVLAAQDVAVRDAGRGAGAPSINDLGAPRHHEMRASPSSLDEPIVQLPGLQGLLMPTYDRVDGLSLPVAADLVFDQRALILQPSLTYRSRLGVVDPRLSVEVRPSHDVRIEAHAARGTRTNDDWIYSDLVNAVTTLFAGSDTRNYFQSDIGEGRVIGHVERDSYAIEPYVGGRYERVSPISATGDVWTMFGRDDSLKSARPNPLVDEGHIASALLGAELTTFSGVVTARLSAQVEQSFTAPAPASNFLQLTVDGAVGFPTVGTQELHFQVHGVATRGDRVPLARYAYLGGSGTLATLDLLEQGGSALVYVESRYLIPIEAIQLPFIGAPVLSVRDAIGGAGVGSLPSLQHEIGAGIGVSALHLDVSTGVAGRKRTRVSLGLSLTM